MDIDDESLAMRDAEGDFDPTRDTTVRVTSLFFYIFYKINISHLRILEFIMSFILGGFNQFRFGL